MIGAAVLLFALVADPGPAQERSSLQKVQQAPIVIKAGRLLDVETGTVRFDQRILIEGETIKAIGPALPIPAGAQVIDLCRATVLPGLIDAHSHLLTNNPDRVLGEDALILAVTQMTVAERALLGAAMAREALEAGITTVRDLGNAGRNADVALRDAIEKGYVQGPRMFVSTRALAPVGGQFGRVAAEARHIIGEEFVEITGADEARRAVRQAVRDGADWIKVIGAHGSVSLAPDELGAIVEEAHRAGRKIAVHAMTDDAARRALDAGADSIEHGWFLSDDVLKEMARMKVFLVPTDASWDMWAEVNGEDSQYAAQTKAVFERARIRLRRAIELGVPVAAGSDAYYQFKRSRGAASVMRMVRSARDAGLAASTIIQSLTIRAAELLGRQDRLGSIKEGALADLIAVEGNPLDDVTVLERVAFVMKGGTVITNHLTEACRDLAPAEFRPQELAVHLRDVPERDLLRVDRFAFAFVRAAAETLGNSVNDLFVDVPVKLGARGVEEIIQITLTAEEQAAFNKSAAAVKELTDVIGV